MWYPRDPLPPNHGRYPPVVHPAGPRSTHGTHARRQSTASFPVIPSLETTSLYPYFQPPLPQQHPQRNFSIQAGPSYSSIQRAPYPYLPPMQQHPQQQDLLQNQPPRRQSGMTHSFSAPWSGYGGSQSTKLYTPRPQQGKADKRPSMKDAVKVSAPQNLDGDVFEDDYEGPKDDDTLKRVYAYQPTAYWAGRLSSLLDRLAAEYPGESRAWRIKRALKNLNSNAYGEGAKHSLDDFKEAFERGQWSETDNNSSELY